MNSPTTITLTVTTALTEANSYKKLVGESTRVTKHYTLHCLFDRILTKATRGKFGLRDIVSGTVFLSPIQLVEVLGHWKYEYHNLKVHLLGKDYVVDTIMYMGEVEEFNSCICVQLRLMDLIHGGA